MKPRERYGRWIILYLVLAAAMIILFLQCCTVENHIDSDPFYGADTIYQQHENRCYTIKTGF